MDNLRKVTRKEQALITKEKLFSSAYRLFAKEGFDKVSIEMITHDAGVAKGSFYVHFASKNTLINEIAQKKVQEMDLRYEKLFKSISDQIPLSEILILVSEKIMLFMTQELGHHMLTIMYQSLLERSEDLNSVTSNARRIYDIYYAIIEKGIASGEFCSPYSAKEISIHLVLALRGLTYQWCILYPNFDVIQETKIHFELLINGLKK